jgi:hypothetical protein
MKVVFDGSCIDLIAENEAENLLIAIIDEKDLELGAFCDRNDDTRKIVVHVVAPDEPAEQPGA